MQMTPIRTIPVRTRTYDTLNLLMRSTANGARLTIVSGAVGIGKTFALRHLVSEHRARGTGVYFMTCRAETSGHVKNTANELLNQYQAGQRNDLEAAEALWTAVAARPFDPNHPTRSLLIVDEAQRLKPNVIEFFRGLWDLGDPARTYKPEAPAFGLVLVGNPTFLSRNGTLQTAEFAALFDRAIYAPLDRPSKQEIRALASSLVGVDAAAALAAYGEKAGNFRSMEKVFQFARDEAGGGVPTLEDIELAIAVMGGAK